MNNSTPILSTNQIRFTKFVSTVVRTNHVCFKKIAAEIFIIYRRIAIRVTTYFKLQTTINFHRIFQSSLGELSCRIE
jgi:hypothetical protein